VKLSLPVTMAAVSAVIWLPVNAPPLDTRVGVPLIDAVLLDSYIDGGSQQRAKERDRGSDARRM
jgi:hypothetical protein